MGARYKHGYPAQDLRPRLLAAWTPEEDRASEEERAQKAAVAIVSSTVELDTPRTQKFERSRQPRAVFIVVYDGTMKFGN